MTSTDDICQLAINLAANCGYAVFPVGENKQPVWPKKQGGQGYKDASTNPDRIIWLWQHWPGLLVGIATGWRSNVAVLDCDIYKPDADAWFSANQHKLPRTLSFETRSGGVHSFYQHHPDLRSSIGQVAPGIDVLSDGRYCVSWWCAGFACLDYRPPEPWPAWLVPAEKSPAPQHQWPKQTVQPVLDEATRKRVEAFVARILSNVETAANSTKHDVLLRTSRTIGGIIGLGGVSPSEAQHELIEALKRNPNRAQVRDWRNAYRTIRDGLNHGIAHPFTLEDRPYARDAA